MTEDIVSDVRRVQVSVLESARSAFAESQIDDLSCIVRLTVEFFHYLRGADLAPLIDDKARYMCESIFSGIPSFEVVSAVYRSLPSSHRVSIVANKPASLDSLQNAFLSEYLEFSGETDFYKKCALLLSLFKIQIVFAGISY